MTASPAPKSAGVLHEPPVADQALSDQALSDQARHEPAGEPVGHAGTRVVVSERECWSLSGWIAVIGLAVVSNLLVVLCGESRATPVVNTGSLYN